jgi:hypothetical protein
MCGIHNLLNTYIIMIVNFLKDFYIIIILVYDGPYLCLNPLLQNVGVVH